MRGAIALIAAATLAACARSDSPSDIETLLAPLVEAGHFNGALVAGRDGEIVYAEGHGPANVEAGARFTPATPSDGGSIAKTFTASAIILLASEGAISIDDPVTDYLPEFPFAGTTVRHLISHTAGWREEYEHLEGAKDARGVLTNEAILAALAAHPPEPAAPPGEIFIYNDIGFDLAALIVERVTGAPFQQFLKERLFDRLGIEDAFARPGLFADWRGVRTRGYRPGEAGLETFDVYEGEGFYGGSNLYFSANDLFRWASGLASGEALDGAVMAECEKPVRLEGGAATGLNACNWYAAGPARHYPGVLEGFYAHVYWNRETGAALGLVANTNMPVWLRPQLVRAVAAILEGRRPAPLAPPPGAALTGETLPAIAGVYALPDGAVELSADQAVVYLEQHDGARYRAFPVDERSIYVPGLDWVLTFDAMTDEGYRTLHASSVEGVAVGARQRR